MSHDYKYAPVAGPSTIPSNQLKDDELFKLGAHELVKRLRKSEGENIRLMSEHGSMMKEINRRMQIHLMEIRTLKEVNQKLQDDSQELRDLCCFLDDDRQKGRKLAREWQRFGRYTASVMRQEVSAYQGKLRDLEGKQQDLMKDNLELKELCLYLDEERVGTRAGSTCTQCGAPLAPHGLRDEGDGSSSSTNNDEPLVLNSYSSPLSQTAANSVRERLLTEYLPRQRSHINEQILHYIKGLEQRVHQLEEEKQTMKFPRTSDGTKPPYPPPYRRPPKPPSESERYQQADRANNPNKRPEAVIHAMKVLELHEQLEKDGSGGNDVDDLGNREKALVKEMCNVVWRTLEDVPPHI